MIYKQSFIYDKKKPLKTALLIIAVGVDILNINFLISGLAGLYTRFIYLAVGIVVMSALRLPTLKMTFERVYIFDGVFKVEDKYVHKSKTILSLNDSCFVIKKAKAPQSLGDNVVKLYNESCGQDIYMIELGERKFLLALDDYMVALILSSYNKELE